MTEVADLLGGNVLDADRVGVHRPPVSIEYLASGEQVGHVGNVIALEVLAGKNLVAYLLQFAFRDELGAEPVELGLHHLFDAGNEALGLGRDTDLEQTGVAVHRVAAPHAGGELQLGDEFLVQPGALAGPGNRARHFRSEELRRVAHSRRVEADEELGNPDPLAHGDAALAVLLRFNRVKVGAGDRHALERPEILSGLHLHVGGRNVAGHDQHGIGRVVVLRVPVADHLDSVVGDVCGPADGGVARGVNQQGDRAELLPELGARVVVVQVAFLAHDLVLAFELGVGKYTLAHARGFDLQGEVVAVLGEIFEVAGEVLGREAVVVAAGRVDDAVEVAGLVDVRVLERHVLQHVGDAGVPDRLIVRANLVVGVGRDDRGGRVDVDDYIEAVRERELSYARLQVGGRRTGKSERCQQGQAECRMPHAVSGKLHAFYPCCLVITNCTAAAAPVLRVAVPTLAAAAAGTAVVERRERRSLTRCLRRPCRVATADARGVEPTLSGSIGNLTRPSRQCKGARAELPRPGHSRHDRHPTRCSGSARSCHAPFPVSTAIGIPLRRDLGQLDIRRRFTRLSMALYGEARHTR